MRLLLVPIIHVKIVPVKTVAIFKTQVRIRVAVLGILQARFAAKHTALLMEIHAETGQVVRM